MVNIVTECDACTLGICLLLPIILISGRGGGKILITYTII
jgi:hypothetical protein